MVLGRPAHGRTRGFTLIELLVAIALMALMAALSWRGLDGMTRAQAQMRERSDQVLTWQAALAQWGADLDAMVQQPDLPSLDWDGRALRVVRGDASDPGAGLRVVAWSRGQRDGQSQWLRWQSPPLTTRAGLQQAWLQAAQWAQNPGDLERQMEVRIAPLAEWQVFYYRGNSWTNPLSSEGVIAGLVVSGADGVPDGIRLVLTLPPGQAISGTLTRDWVSPAVGGGK
jgi:general secretion pathway protein J